MAIYSNEIDKKIIGVNELLQTNNSTFSLIKSTKHSIPNKASVSFPVTAPSYRSVPTFVPRKITLYPDIGQLVLIKEPEKKTKVNLKINK